MPGDGVVACCDVGMDEPMAALSKKDFEALAGFRFAIRSYLRFSEDTVRSHGLSPQQYQLLLALAGFPGREWATVKELSERLHSSTTPSSSWSTEPSSRIWSPAQPTLTTRAPSGWC